MSDIIKIEGLSKLKATLRQLPVKLQRKAAKPALTKGGNVVLEASKTKAPVGPIGNRWSLTQEDAGPIKDSFRLTSVRSSQKGEYLKISVENYAYYARWVERGHRIVRIKRWVDEYGKERKQVRKFGSVPSHPFMYPALVESASKVLTVFRDELEANLEKIVK